MIERDFDVPFVARLARREKQIQQSYRPVIGVHKWFARRPGSLFRGLLLAEFAATQPLDQSYFQGHDLGPLVVGDPFMGGGTPLLEANRLGCHVVGADVNPMAYWIVRQELAELDLHLFRAAADKVIESVEHQLGELYSTTCIVCGHADAAVKYFLWSKCIECARCHHSIDLFSSYLVAKNQRHPRHVLLCAACGTLNECDRLDRSPAAMRCSTCRSILTVEGPASRGRCQCSHCGYTNSYPAGGVPEHHLYAIEYHCDRCQPAHAGRFFKQPDAEDRARYAEAERRLQAAPRDFIPEDSIPLGDETRRLHRWGYERYRELFNARQLFGLETLASAIAQVDHSATRHALLTVFSDTLRYQNLLCRYDSYALKIIDIFSVHGYPVSLNQCENSLLGMEGIGSGGFRHFIRKYERAKQYCQSPFEIYPGQPRRTVSIKAERIGADIGCDFPSTGASRIAFLQAASASEITLPPHSLDAVMTDPPYFGNVQYAELMDFCYVWLRKHLAAEFPAFRGDSTRSEHELTVNQTEGRDIEHFAEGLSSTFVNFARALKPGRPFAFTYHHNTLEAYLPVAAALLDAGLVCTATLPCPAEMEASIHISGTESSVIDTILVCRSTGVVQAREFHTGVESLRQMLRVDIANLRQAGLSPTPGDVSCLLYGHMVRLVIWQLRCEWQSTLPTSERLALVRSALHGIYAPDLLKRLAAETLSESAELDALPLFQFRESKVSFDGTDQISF